MSALPPPMAALAGLLAAALVITVRQARPVVPSRIEGLVTRAGERRDGGGRFAALRGRGGSLARRFDAAAVAVGRRARGAFGREPHPVRDRRAGRAGLVGVIAGLVAGPLVGVGLGLASWCAPTVRRRAARRRHHERLLDDVPEVVELFRVAAAAGLTVRASVDAVARHGDGPVAEAVTLVAHRAARGDRLADALADLDGLGEPVRPLLDALLAAERHGAPLLAALDRVAAEGRDARRRHHEAAARRVPVRLLFPLVLCTLPALGLLTVVPVIARSWPSLAP